MSRPAASLYSSLHPRSSSRRRTAPGEAHALGFWPCPSNSIPPRSYHPSFFSTTHHEFFSHHTLACNSSSSASFFLSSLSREKDLPSTVDSASSLPSSPGVQKRRAARQDRDSCASSRPLGGSSLLARGQEDSSQKGPLWGEWSVAGEDSTGDLGRYGDRESESKLERKTDFQRCPDCGGVRKETKKGRSSAAAFLGEEEEENGWDADLCNCWTGAELEAWRGANAGMFMEVFEWCTYSSVLIHSHTGSRLEDPFRTRRGRAEGPEEHRQEGEEDDEFSQESKPWIQLVRNAYILDVSADKTQQDFREGKEEEEPPVDPVST